jgi:hypothetical protein
MSISLKFTRHEHPKKRLLQELTASHNDSLLPLNLPMIIVFQAPPLSVHQDIWNNCNQFTRCADNSGTRFRFYQLASRKALTQRQTLLRKPSNYASLTVLLTRKLLRRKKVISSPRIETRVESHCQSNWKETRLEGLIRMLHDLTTTHNDSHATRLWLLFSNRSDRWHTSKAIESRQELCRLSEHNRPHSLPTNLRTSS